MRQVRERRSRLDVLPVYLAAEEPWPNWPSQDSRGQLLPLKQEVAVLCADKQPEIRPGRGCSSRGAGSTNW